MRRWLCVLTAVAVSFLPAAAQAEGWGNLIGKFVYDGDAPAPDPLQVDKDLQCCGKYKNEIVDESLVVGEDGGIANIFVYLRNSRTNPAPINPAIAEKVSPEVVVDNARCIFNPHVAALWVDKQKLVVNNKDACGQGLAVNCFINPQINVLLPVGGQFENKFATAERVPAGMKCTIHKWESAHLLLNDSPYFAITGKDGIFKIEGLPEGEWEFQVWQERAGYLAAKSTWERGRFTVPIKDGKTTNVGLIKCDPSLFKTE